ncbi:sigma-70 family RNA polymerase sigma factor [Microterricola pindariensis]|uniref:Flagellar biosynthesis protein FliA n=1 Tax=Microterricola pindariensis TaxID=478010 RepID=A0ABX5AS13_9MICO|nr:sigma-70 family RNA polymerase sigma factor [Microterricola pindariensis]PPL15250.1 flagellar biosynthesis protein FliA [Microterricola pindariensis]
MNRAERNELVVANLPLVGYLVADVCARATHLSRDDLAAAGALALVHCADNFDIDRGIPFGAYARTRILGAFADEMRSSDWATRSARKRITETVSAREALTASLGRVPSVDELAAALGVDRETASAALSDAARTVTTIDDSTAEYLVSEMTSPEESLLLDERQRYVTAAVDALPERMAMIVRAIYFDDRSVKEVAEELGISHSAVSQQRSEGLRLIRDGLGSRYSDDAEVQSLPDPKVTATRRVAYLSRFEEHLGQGTKAASVTLISNVG